MTSTGLRISSDRVHRLKKGMGKIVKMHSRSGRFSGLLRMTCICVLALTAAVQPSGVFASTKIAVDPVGHSENYSAVLYDNVNGLPVSESNDIAQTGEGFIWIATYAGLILYDGNTFERVEGISALKSVACLYVDSKDRLWVGSNDSGAALIDGGDLVGDWDAETGLPTDKIRGFAEDDKGNIYIGATGGVVMMTPDQKMVDLDDPRIDDAMIEKITATSDGTIFCTTSDMKWFTLRDGKVTDFISFSDIPIENISCIETDTDDPGKVMIGTLDGGYYHGDIHGKREDFEYVDINPLSGPAEIERYGDQIWVCARNGIGVIDSNGFHLLDKLPMNNSVSHIMSDYEGNLWFTSTRQGVMKLVPNRFTDVFEQYGIEPRVVNTTCIAEGKLFIGTDTGLVVVEGNEALKELPLSSVRMATGEAREPADLIALLDGCRIRSVIEDSSGRLWISTWGSLGLLRYDKGEVMIFDESTGLISNYIRAVCEDNDGSILAVGTGGVSVISGDAVVRNYGKEEGLTNTECLSITVAPNGDKLVGSNGAGIYIINDEGVRVLYKKDGLESGVIMRIKFDARRKLFWIVTGNSLAYMSEDYKIKTVDNFPFSDNFDLFENSKADMWVISSDGIYVAPVSDLLSDSDIKAVHYDLENGIKSEATSNSYNQLTEDGKLFISGRTGVTMVNIEEPLEIIDNLKQAVPYIDVDGERIYSSGKGSFTIPSSARKLTIYPYVFNYSLTDPQLSYQLKGFDRYPVTIRRSELDPVTYTNLPGGKYIFNMELKDALGRGSKMLPVTIVKRKAIYERMWFYALVGTAIILMAFGLIRTYMGRKISELEEKHREEKERERVNHELQTANRIQASMLPHDFPPFPDRDEFEIFASMDPAKEVGGDFYDFFFIDEDQLCLIMADVSGKGIPAAMYMMNSKVTLQGLAASGNDPAEILKKTNEALCKNNTEMFVTVWLGILDLKTGKLRAANAGHEFPAIRQGGGQYELYKDKHGFVIGGMEGMQYKDYELQLEPGDSLFLYTDGVPEATNSKEEMFGTDRMLDALNSAPYVSPLELLINVRTAVEDFVQEAEQFDDLTMLCINYNGSSEEKTEEGKEGK